DAKPTGFNEFESAAPPNSLNPVGLASAVGSGNFVNPTTNISPEMNQAVSTSVALDFGVQINRKWTLESGVAYTSVDNTGVASINVLDVFTIDNTNFIAQGQQVGLDNGDVVAPSLSAREATIEVERNYDHEVEINNRVQFASIPLKAGYFVVDKKFSLRLNAGLSANYLMEGNISDPTNQILNSDQLNLYNEWSFDGVGGMEFGYSIFERINFTLEPNYRHAITPISNTSSMPSRFVLQTGLRYTLN
ncbi:MAG: outer membrane beta-barrel protein, partial [Bacteroidota bacterium]